MNHYQNGLRLGYLIAAHALSIRCGQINWVETHESTSTDDEGNQKRIKITVTFSKGELNIKVTW